MTEWLAPDPATVAALGWTLVHFAWQGLAVAMLLGMTLLLVRERSASVRHAAALAAMLLMLAAPVGTLCLLMSSGGHAAAPITVRDPVMAGTETAAAFLPAGAEAPLPLRARLESALPWLVAAWVAGVTVLSLRALGGWFLTRRVMRSGHPVEDAGLQVALARLVRRMGVRRAVRLCESALVAVPTVIGWVRPVILFPVATLAGLSPAQLELILAHELAHIRRLDYLVNLLQTLVETLLFYHPAVWWVSHRVRLEREHCCDDDALRTGGDAVAYARALTELEALQAASPGLAMAASGGSLAERVRRLVGPRESLGARGRRRAGAALALTALVAAAATTATLRAANPPEESRVVDAITPVVDEHATRVEERQPLLRRVAARTLAAVMAPAVDVVDLADEPALDEPEDEAPLADDAQEDAQASAAEAAENASEAAQSAAEAAESTTEAAASEAGALSLEEVLEIARLGVTPDYLDEMDALGYGNLSVQALRALREQGVTPEFVRELKEQGYAELSPRQLVALRRHGVDPDYVRELKEQGFTGLSLTSLVTLRRHGVDPDEVGAFREAGYGDLTATDLVALRSHGVDPDDVVDLKALGYTDLSVSRLIALRSMGVDAD